MTRIALHSPPFTTGTYTTTPANVDFGLLDTVAQRSATFRFALANGLTGEVKDDLTPIRNASLTHDTARTIKRQLNLNLGVYDTSRVDPLVDRVRVYMLTADGSEWPLGKYMFTDSSLAFTTAGDQANAVLNDEMFLVDQQISKGVNGVGASIVDTIAAVLEDLPINWSAEHSFFQGSQAWTLGSGRGQILQDLSLAGDYFPPWFDNDGILQFIRSFNPALQPADFDFDTGKSVVRAGIVQTSDILTAPNRFIVVSNAGSNTVSSIVGIADVPVNAPNSFANRGFYIVDTQDLQISDTPQAQAVANNLALRSTVFERVTLTTAPDPRHDSYNVIQWQGEKWLETSWSMNLLEGATMSHSLRKAYT